MAYKKQYPEKEARDHQQELTDKFAARIEEALANVEKGLKWEKPFMSSTEWPRNALTGEKYHGVNVVSLLSEEFSDPRWLTFKQMQELANKEGKTLQLEKGSKAAYVMKVVPAYEKNEDGSVKKNNDGNPIPVVDENGKPKIGFKWYPVFNMSQIKGVEPYIKPNLDVKPFEAVEILSAALQERTGLKVVHSTKSAAYYSPSEHKIHMPNPELFKSAEAYADTFFHEAGHSTGPALGRKVEGGYGSESYAREELVAELTSSFMSVEMGIPHNPSTHENQAAYLKSWLSALKNDKKFLFTASAQASKATEYQMGHFNAYKEDLVKREEFAKGMTDALVVKSKGAKQVASMSI